LQQHEPVVDTSSAVKSSVIASREWAGCKEWAGAAMGRVHSTGCPQWAVGCADGRGSCGDPISGRCTLLPQGWCLRTQRHQCSAETHLPRAGAMARAKSLRRVGKLFWDAE
jgi:hypothetical protein